MSAVQPVNALEEFVEVRHDCDDRIVQLVEQWQDRLRLPLTEIPKRYRGNKLGVVLHMCLGLDLGEFSLLITHESLLGDIRTDCDPATGEAQNKLFMFIRNVHVMDNEQGMDSRVGGVVRLKSIDQAQNGAISDSLYLSFVTGKTVFVPWSRFQNGKFDIPGVFAGAISGRGELPNNVVKAGAQMVGYFAHQNTEAERDGLLLKVMARLKEKLHIVLWEVRTPEQY
jgi:hypothetical protein